MVWMFARDEETMRVETQYDHRTRDYVLRVWRSNGGYTTETFPTTIALEARLADFERTLQADKWHSSAPQPRMAETWHI
jgi:hypothetical protein